MLTGSVAPELAAAYEGRWSRSCENELSSAAAAAAAAAAALSAKIPLLGLCGQITAAHYGLLDPTRASEDQRVEKFASQPHEQTQQQSST
jgi:hypothetical protein